MDIKKLTADEIEYLNYFIYTERHSCNIEPNLKDNFSFLNGYEWYFEETNSALTKEFKKELKARLKSGQVDVFAIKKVNVFREYQKNIVKESDLFMSLFSYWRQQSAMQQDDFIIDTIEKGNEFLRFAKERYNNFVENEMKIPTLENDHKLFLLQNIEFIKKWIDWIKGNKDNLPKKGIDIEQLFTKLNENQPLLDTDIIKIIIEQTKIKIDAEMKYFEQKYNTIHFFTNIFRTVTLFNARVGNSINKDIQFKRELLMELKIYEKELDSILQTFTLHFYKVDAKDINKLVITFKAILNFYKTVCLQFRYDLSKSYFYETILKFENEYEAIVIKLLQLQNKGIEGNVNVGASEKANKNEKLNKADLGRLIYILVAEFNFKDLNDAIPTCEYHCSIFNREYTDYVRQCYKESNLNQLKTLQKKVNVDNVLGKKLLEKFNVYANNKLSAYH